MTAHTPACPCVNEAGAMINKACPYHGVDGSWSSKSNGSKGQGQGNHSQGHGGLMSITKNERRIMTPLPATKVCAYCKFTPRSAAWQSCLNCEQEYCGYICHQQHACPNWTERKGE